MKNGPNIETSKELAKSFTLHTNLHQDVLKITSDKIELCLNKHRDGLCSKQSWHFPLGLFLTILTTLLVSDFKDRWLKANVWSAIYIVSCFLSLIWLFRATYNAWKNRNLGSTETILKELKAQTKDVEELNT